jgi:hypothetical protein
MLATRFLAAALAGSLLTGPASAQRPFAPKPTPAPVAVNAPGPWANKFFMADIQKNPTAVPPPVITHDFGTVPFGTLCTQKFSITNIYDVPIQVIDVRVECGCLKGYPPNKVLLPNESAEFTATMNSAMFKGKQSKKMYVTFGPNYVSTAELRFEATSREDITLGTPGQPGEIDFGTLAQGQKATKSLPLKYTGKQRDWAVTGALAAKGPFEIDVKEKTRGPLLGIEYTITVGLKADAQPGELSETLTLKTNDPAAPQVLVNVRGFVQAPITASPGRVDFGDMKVGDIASQRILVRSATATKIAPVADAGDGITVETNFSGEAQQQVIVVKFAPKAPGAVRKEVKLQSNLPGNAATVVVVEANVK